MNCEFAHDDGSYVLGALSPADRQAFEQHLGRCDDCARSVRQLAGLPGLLARVDARVLEDTPETEPVPPTLLPALVRRVRHGRRRRRLVTAGIAAVAALIVSLLAVGVLTGRDNPGTPVANPPSSAGAQARQAMSQVDGGALRASVGFASVAWGTRLDLTCSYATQYGRGGTPSTPYSLFVRTRDGGEQQIATWRGIPGKTVALTAATEAPRQDITAVEVRTAGGKVVLRLTS